MAQGCSGRIRRARRGGRRPARKAERDELRMRACWTPQRRSAASLYHHESKRERTMTTRRAVLIAATVLGATSLAAHDVLAQADATPFPDHTVRIIVPFPAGGATDVIARALAERMSASWKQPVIV